MSASILVDAIVHYTLKTSVKGNSERRTEERWTERLKVFSSSRSCQGSFIHFSCGSTQCDFSSAFTPLLSLWLFIQTPPWWDLLSAYRCNPHWFGLVLRLGQPTTKSNLILQTAGLRPFKCPPWFFSLSWRKWKQHDKIRLHYFTVCAKTVDIFPWRMWPFHQCSEKVRHEPQH